MVTIELTDDQAGTLLCGFHPRSTPAATEKARWAQFERDSNAAQNAVRKALVEAGYWSAQPPQDSEVSSEGLAGEIAHFRELAAGERRAADRAVAGSSEESRYHGRATVYEHVVDRLRKLAEHPDTYVGEER